MDAVSGAVRVTTPAFAKIVGANFELLLDSLVADIVIDPTSHKCIMLLPHMDIRRPLFRIQYNRARCRFELITGLSHVAIDGVPSTTPMVPLPLGSKSLVDLGNGYRFYFLLPLQAMGAAPSQSSSASPVSSSPIQRAAKPQGRMSPGGALATLATAAAQTAGPPPSGASQGYGISSIANTMVAADAFPTGEKPEKAFPDLIIEAFEYNRSTYLDGDVIISTIKQLYPYYRNAPPKDLEVPVKLTLTAQKKFKKSNENGTQVWSICKQQTKGGDQQAAATNIRREAPRTKGTALPGVDRHRRRTGKEFTGSRNTGGRQRDILKHYSFLKNNYTVLPPLDPN